MQREGQPTWQPVTALGLVGSMIDAQLEGGRDQYQTVLQASGRAYVLDDATVTRALKVYRDAADDLWLYDEQLARWQGQALTAAQGREVERLVSQMAALREVVDQILGLATQLKHETIDTLVAKSDLEIGIEWLLRGRDS